jgi:hypothetical protein
MIRQVERSSFNIPPPEQSATATRELKWSARMRPCGRGKDRKPWQADCLVSSRRWASIALRDRRGQMEEPRAATAAARGQRDQPGQPSCLIEAGRRSQSLLRHREPAFPRQQGPEHADGRQVTSRSWAGCPPSGRAASAVANAQGMARKGGRECTLPAKSTPDRNRGRLAFGASVGGGRRLLQAS